MGTGGTVPSGSKGGGGGISRERVEGRRRYGDIDGGGEGTEDMGY